MIYLDNAATSLQKPKEVEEEMIRAIHTMGNPGRGAHDATLQAGRCVYQVREQLAQLFNAESADCIAFTSNATEALNTAILGLFQKGDHVITTVCEHNSVLRPLYRLQKQGVEVSFLSADEQGILDYDKLPALIKENTKAVIVTHASTIRRISLCDISFFMHSRSVIFPVRFDACVTITAFVFSFISAGSL